MPDAWDNNNIEWNLGVLADLPRSRPGAKLLLNSNGRFSIQQPGMAQSLSRTFTRGASVTDDQTFLDPIARLVRAAIRCCDAGTRLPGGTVEVTDLARARRGIEWLRDHTYSTGQKRAKLDEVMRVLNVEGAFCASWVNFSRKWEHNSVFAFAQGRYLSEQNEGVCLALCIDWVKRICKDKPTYGSSKHADKNAPTGQEDLDPLQHARMLRKIPRIQQLQDRLDAARYQEVHRFVNQNEDEFDFKLVKDRVVPAFGNQEPGHVVINRILDLASVRPHPRIYVITLHGRANGHAWGLDLREGLHFFDPDNGEFHFRDLELFRRFFDDLWKIVKSRRDGIAYETANLYKVRDDPHLQDTA